MAISTASLEQSVVGILRAGDIVDIYLIEQHSEKVEVKNIIDDIEIERSYDASGASIARDDKTSLAQIITIPVHESSVSAIYEALAQGTIKMVKVLE